LVQLSFSQSEYLLRGQSGFGSGFGLNTNNEASGFNVNAGYSYFGFIDGNIKYEKSNGGSVQGGVLTPSITFYPVKQEDAPASPTIGISLGFSRYRSITTTKVEEQDTAGIGWHWQETSEDRMVNALILGVTAQRRTGYWNVLFFQPILSAGLVMKNAGWEFSLQGGVSMGTRVVNGPLLILTPSIERQSGLTTFILTFGAVF